MSNLLKEAIADARAVRQTALANAKVALEEAFSEKYQAMFAEKLKEDAMTSDQVQSSSPVTEEEGNQSSGDTISEQEIDELIKELESEVSEDSTPNPDDDNKEEMPSSPDIDGTSVPNAGAPVGPQGAESLGAPAPTGVPPGGCPAGCVPISSLQIAPGAPGSLGAPAPTGVPPGVPPTDGVPPAPAPSVPSDVPQVSGQEEDEDINLDELLESLKEEIEKDETDKDEKSIDENAPVKSSSIGPGNNKQPSSDAQKTSNISDASQSIRSGKVGWPDGEKIVFDPETVVTSKENFGNNRSASKRNTPKFSDKHKGENVSEAVETGVPEGTVTSKEPTQADRPNMGEHAAKDNLDTVPFSNKHKGENVSETVLQKENKNLKKQLNETEDAIKYLKVQLNEINILNAKLLYTNKLFKEYNMNNEQKMRIVEMFDLSKNVREVKLTYANIAESLNFSNNNIKRKVAPAISTNVQSITEGLASKPVGSTKPTKQIISESKSDMVSKFQKLAGITKR